MNDYKEIAKYMLMKKLSLREMAKELDMPKSTLYDRLDKAKWFFDKDFAIEFETHLRENKKNMHVKGGIARKNKQKGKGN